MGALFISAVEFHRQNRTCQLPGFGRVKIANRIHNQVLANHDQPN